VKEKIRYWLKPNDINWFSNFSIHKRLSMRSCTTRTLHVSRAIAILGYAAQVSVRAGSVIAHLASLNRDGPLQTFVQRAANVGKNWTLVGPAGVDNLGDWLISHRIQFAGDRQSRPFRIPKNMYRRADALQFSCPCVDKVLWVCAVFDRFLAYQGLSVDSHVAEPGSQVGRWSNRRVI